MEDKRLYTTTVRFEWDSPKAKANLRAHGVSFAEAVTVLEDDFALTREDPDVADERRFVSLGSATLEICWSLCTHIANLTQSD